MQREEHHGHYRRTEYGKERDLEQPKIRLVLLIINRFYS